MSSSCDIYLCPAGATDITTIISEIAVSVRNSGMYSWMPDSSLSVSEAEIIIVDSEVVTIISSAFGLYNSNGSYSGGGSYYDGHNLGSKVTTSKSYESQTMNQYTHETYTKTYEYHEHGTKTEESGGEQVSCYWRSLYSSHSEHEQTSFITVAVNGSYQYTTASTSFTTVQGTTTVAGAVYTYAMTTSIPPPIAAASTMVASVYYSSTASNSSSGLAVNATPTAAPFTGSAPRSSSAFYSAIVGGLAGMVAMLFL